jgi:hypothetical protein
MTVYIVGLNYTILYLYYIYVTFLFLYKKIIVA